MGRRTLLLIASILVAAVGTGLVGLYALNANNRAKGDARLTPVLVAIAPIPAGFRVDENYAQVQQRPAGDLPPGALTSLAAATGRAVNPVLQGQILQAEMFSSDGAPAARKLAAGHQAVSVSMGDPQRVAPLLTPESEVYIYVVPKDGNGAGKSFPVFDPGVRIPVIGVGSDTTAPRPQPTATSAVRVDGAEGGLATSVVTLDLNDDQVRTLIDADVRGELRFGWVGTITPTTGAPR